MRSSSLVALVIAFAGCTRANPNYCPGAPDNNCNNVDAGPDAPMRCAASDECTQDGALVCKLPDGICVECVDRSTCMKPAEPVCDTTVNECVGCRSHGDCPASGACLPDGSCADPAQVAYVAANGTGNCTFGSPCGTLALGLMKGTATIKMIGPGVIADSTLTTIARAVTIVADRGAVLDNTVNGPILEVRTSTADVRIYDLEITGGVGADADAIVLGVGMPKLTLERCLIHHNGGLGINASGGTVTVRRSVFAKNDKGGLLLSNTQFDLTNNVIAGNGGTAADVGGLQLGAPATYVFQFNTVADNATRAGAMFNGINCTGPITLSNNIVTGNKATPMCAFEYSLFDPGTAIAATNLVGDPAFRNILVDEATSPTFYRIAGASAALDKANAAATIAVDIDGDVRPQGAGRDLGADELKP
jgi:hypothetical protein